MMHKIVLGVFGIVIILNLQIMNRPETEPRACKWSAALNVSSCTQCDTFQGEQNDFERCYAEYEEGDRKLICIGQSESYYGFCGYVASYPKLNNTDCGTAYEETGVSTNTCSLTAKFSCVNGTFENETCTCPSSLPLNIKLPLAENPLSEPKPDSQTQCGVVALITSSVTCVNSPCNDKTTRSTTVYYAADPNGECYTYLKCVCIDGYTGEDCRAPPKNKIGCEPGTLSDLSSQNPTITLDSITVETLSPLKLSRGGNVNGYYPQWSEKQNTRHLLKYIKRVNGSTIFVINLEKTDLYLTCTAIGNYCNIKTIPEKTYDEQNCWYDTYYNKGISTNPTDFDPLNACPFTGGYIAVQNFLYAKHDDNCFIQVYNAVQRGQNWDEFFSYDPSLTNGAMILPPQFSKYADSSSLQFGINDPNKYYPVSMYRLDAELQSQSKCPKCENAPMYNSTDYQGGEVCASFINSTIFACAYINYVNATSACVDNTGCSASNYNCKYLTSTRLKICEYNATGEDTVQSLLEQKCLSSCEDTTTCVSRRPFSCNCGGNKTFEALSVVKESDKGRTALKPCNPTPENTHDFYDAACINTTGLWGLTCDEKWVTSQGVISNVLVGNTCKQRRTCQCKEGRDVDTQCTSCLPNYSLKPDGTCKKWTWARTCTATPTTQSKVVVLTTKKTGQALFSLQSNGSWTRFILSDRNLAKLSINNYYNRSDGQLKSIQGTFSCPLGGVACSSSSSTERDTFTSNFTSYCTLRLAQSSSVLHTNWDTSPYQSYLADTSQNDLPAQFQFYEDDRPSDEDVCRAINNSCWTQKSWKVVTFNQPQNDCDKYAQSMICGSIACAKDGSRTAKCGIKPDYNRYGTMKSYGIERCKVFGITLKECDDDDSVESSSKAAFASAVAIFLLCTVVVMVKLRGTAP